MEEGTAACYYISGFTLIRQRSRERKEPMGRYKADHVIKVNGVRLHYAVEGKGDPVILLHGNGEDHSLFDLLIGQLTEAGYKVYAPDSRGHGESDPVDEFHYSEMAEDIYQFIESLGLEKPALYGHSDGGIIALLLEMNHPGTLAVMAVSGTNLHPEGLISSFIEEFTQINETRHDPMITLMLTEPQIRPEELGKIKIPVLVTAGENDLVRPEETERLCAALADVRKVIVEGADHGSYIHNSPLMGEMLMDFLKDRWNRD